MWVIRSVLEVTLGRVSEAVRVAGGTTEVGTATTLRTVTATATAPQAATASATTPAPATAQRQQPPPRPPLVRARGTATAPLTAPHLGPPQPRPAHERAGLPRARCSHAPEIPNFRAFVRSPHEDAGFEVKAHATLVTRLSPYHADDSREPGRTRAGDDRNRIVSERQRGPIRRSVVSSRGGVGSTSEPGSGSPDDTPGDDQ